MDDEVEISVIVPVYNGEKYINQLMAQMVSFERIELILVDDGSSDNSWEFMLQESKKYGNVCVYHKKNEGIASARNYGLRCAKGKYIVFMDQDDQCDINILWNICKQLKALEADFLISNYSVISEGGEECIGAILDNHIVSGEQIKKIAKDFLTSRRIGFHKMSEECKIKDVPPVVWNCIFCRDFLINNNIYFVKFVDYEDDFTFLVQCLCKARKICTSKEKYYKWFVRKESESHREKYIENFYKKNLQLNQWLLLMSKQCGIGGGEEVYIFECWLYKSSCIRGFTNICSRANEASFLLKRRELKKIVESNMKKEKLRYEDSYFKERVVIFLLKHRLYAIALIWDSIYKALKYMLKRNSY